MENQEPRPTIYVPAGTDFYAPESVWVERIGTLVPEPKTEAPADRPAPVAWRPERPERAVRPASSTRHRSKRSRHAKSESDPVRKVRALKPWFEPLIEEEEGPDGPDESLTVPPEILALAEAAMASWEMKVRGMTLAATKPEKGWGAIWRIETDHGPRSLKLLHRPFERNLFSIYAQEYLVEQKARVAPLVRTREGELHTLAGERMFIVTDWIQGLHPATKVTPDGAAALCTGLAEFHRLSQGYQPPPEAYNASRLHRWPGVYAKMRAKIDWFEHLARAYGEMPASRLLLEVLPRFRGQADEAMALLEKSAFRELIARGDQAWGLVHQGDGSERLTPLTGGGSHLSAPIGAYHAEGQWGGGGAFAGEGCGTVGGRCAAWQRGQRIPGLAGQVSDTQTPPAGGSKPGRGEEEAGVVWCPLPSRSHGVCSYGFQRSAKTGSSS